MQTIRCLLFWLCFALPLMVEARPVSYPGGWTLMLNNNGDRNSALIHYSIDARTSVGYRFEHWRDRDFSIHAAQLNHLVKRWNKRDSQANVYLQSGLGIATDNSSGADKEGRQPAAFLGLASDWEDQRYFLSYSARYTDAGDIDDFFAQSGRVGWAPYVGDYGDLHTWLMLEAQHMPEAEHELTLTPMVRLFKNVHLLEVGLSQRGDFLLNYIFRY